MDTKARAFAIGAGADPELVKNRVRSKCPGALVQTVRAGLAANAFFAEMIAAQTIRAEATGALLAERPEIDLLLRLAQTTQISEAIERAGSKKGEPFLLVVASMGKGLGSLDKLRLGRELPRKRLSEPELVAIEKAALLNVLRA
ncbi:MAG: KEOPS complex subunit Cgi121 [Thaumarchaeota archaeon]|nr:KEOPS complex subunit Cgi121 [Nitrososphaerota archaeon]